MKSITNIFRLKLNPFLLVFNSLKGIFSQGAKSKPQKEEIYVTFIKDSREVVAKAKPGDNLMDVSQNLVNEGVEIFGLCDKQLACTTCSVHVRNHYEKLNKPQDEELDILYSLPEFHYNSTRMSCQITLEEDMDGLIVQIPDKIVEANLDEFTR